MVDTLLVNWPPIHKLFKDDVVFFATEPTQIVAHGRGRRPAVTVVYTLAELARLKGSSAATLRLVHLAKRSGATLMPEATRGSPAQMVE